MPREGLQHEAIENEREYYEMFEQQETYKKKAAIQSKINEKRIEDMYRTQEELQEKFVDVNQFMKECMEKTVRAETQIASELKQQEVLKKDIEAIKRDIDELSVFEKKFKDVVKEFQCYEDVFNEVIKQSEFKTFEDMINRCDSLSTYR